MRVFAIAAAVLCLSRRAEGQALSGQDATLAGMRAVTLNVVTARADSTELREAIALELRKAGIRLVNTGVADGAIDVIVRDNCNRGTLRLIVAQPARLVRSGATSRRLVTWFYEDDGIVCGRRVAGASRKATDRLLTAWLSANGR